MSSYGKLDQKYWSTSNGSNSKLSKHGKKNKIIFQIKHLLLETETYCFNIYFQQVLI